MFRYSNNPIKQLQVQYTINKIVNAVTQNNLGIVKESLGKYLYDHAIIEAFYREKNIVMVAINLQHFDVARCLMNAYTAHDALQTLVSDAVSLETFNRLIENTQTIKLYDGVISALLMTACKQSNLDKVNALLTLAGTKICTVKHLDACKSNDVAKLIISRLSHDALRERMCAAIRANDKAMITLLVNHEINLLCVLHNGGDDLLGIAKRYGMKGLDAIIKHPATQFALADTTPPLEFHTEYGGCNNLGDRYASIVATGLWKKHEYTATIDFAEMRKNSPF